MKKIVFAVIAFSSLMVLSCRQQDDMMDSEDLKSLSVLKEATSKTKNLKSKQISDSTTVSKEADVKVNLIQESEIDSLKPPL